MENILRIEASARQEGSLTRMLSTAFFEQWKQDNASFRIMVRDVGANPPPSLHASWIAAAFTPETARSREDQETLALSDRLIEEVTWADVIVMATPMYNYGMPSSLKAWLDHVVRIDKTFSFDLARGDRPLEPTLQGKQLVLLTASGEFGFEPGGINDGEDHLTPHIQSVAKYLGVSEIQHVAIEYQEFKDDRFERSKNRALQSVRELASRMSLQKKKMAA
ncbi:FMN-dependent NADH-azoreductase [Aestuariispira insulae]|uniref:FMN dependent NADH:quinone oxidoreductase n=1 Tax=Aestuariispira insulae TaxID=1461337 RepID=A0A3D9HVA0_9PROT|nr:NAD(P)H-dependent oxidoreductase [Aestuariispira insulae]RED53311.1 FMN-dependent NADH-azoreductase [Aestuariispira insulae]